MKRNIYKLLKLGVGQIIVSLAIAMIIVANIGVFPTTLLNLSLTNLTGLSFGFISMAVEVVMIVACLCLGMKKIGISTLCNALLGGYVISFLTPFIPVPTLLVTKLIYVILGSFILAFGYYMTGSIGWGKASSNLLTACIIQKTGLSITKVKIIQEILFTAIGLIGAWKSFNVATIILAVCFGWIMDFVYKLLHYEPSKVVHQTIKFKRVE